LAIAVNLLLFAAPTLAADQPSAPTPAFYDRPVLVIDPGMHTNLVRWADADVEGRWAVTASEDKTVRIWSLADGALLQTIRLPAGPGEIGRAEAVAMSPDGALVAAGGWTRATKADRQEQIYLFDRATGVMRRRIVGLQSTVSHLTFSPDGNFLAAIAWKAGLRLYARDRDWAEVARDVAYGNPSYGAAFAPDGRLATTEFEGKIRLYAGRLIGDIRPTTAIMAPGGRRPWDIAFSPDGNRLAVGHNAPAAVDVLDGYTLASLPGPDLPDIEHGYLTSVAWSTDDRTLFAAGRYQTGDTYQVLAWSDAGTGARRALPAGSQVMALVPLPAGDLLVAAGAGWLARLQANGDARWVRRSPVADFSSQHGRLSVSRDGTQIDFGSTRTGRSLRDSI
jgi:WD40 repeat protein